MCIGTLPGRVAPNSDAVNLPLLFVMVMKLVSVPHSVSHPWSISEPVSRYVQVCQKVGVISVGISIKYLQHSDIQYV